MSGFNFAGDVRLGLWVNGVAPTVFSDPINATEVSFNQPAADKKSRIWRGKNNSGTNIETISSPKAETVKIVFDEASGQQLAHALRALFATFTQSAASAQAFTVNDVVLDEWHKLGVWPVSTVAISGKVEGTDFIVEPDCGLIRFPSSGSIVSGADVTGTLSRVAISGQKFRGGIVSEMTITLIGDGVNRATGKKGRLELDKALVAVDGDRNLLSDEFMQTTLSGEIGVIDVTVEPYRFYEYEAA